MPDMRSTTLIRSSLTLPSTAATCGFLFLSGVVARSTPR
jgi:hypothetical protein